MASVSFTSQELELINALLKRELQEFISDEPLQADPLTLRGEAGYEEFLKSLLEKMKGVHGEG